jgi:hypothetical protein
VSIPRPGGNSLSFDLDQRRNLDKYVHLSFNEDQPMLYIARREGRIPNPVMFLIDPVVMTWVGTVFTDRNATDNQVNMGPKVTDLEKIDFGVVLSKWKTESEKRAYQAEVLVPTEIPIAYVLEQRRL